MNPKDPLRCRCVLFIALVISGIGTNAQSINNPEVDHAYFIGGETALDEYIVKKFRLPERYYERKEGYKVNIIVSFLVDEGGCVTEVSVVNDDEVPKDVQMSAIRLFKRMKCKKWMPARKDGKAVSMRFRKSFKASLPPEKN